MADTIPKTGELFNLKVNDQLLKGWVLFVTNEDEEFLIKQNSNLIGFKKYKVKRKIYQIEESLKENIFEKEDMKEKIKRHSESKAHILAIALIVSGLIRAMVSKELLFGNSNIPIDMFQGFYNLSLFWLVFLMIHLLVLWFRYQKLLLFLKNHGNELKLVGKAYEVNRKKEKINKIKLGLALLFFFFFILFSVIVLPFIVQERLFAVLTVMLFVEIFLMVVCIRLKRSVSIRLKGS